MIKTTLGIKGMMCHNCERHVNEAVQEIFAVKKVTSSHEADQTEIISEGELAEEELRKVIEKAGYEMTSFESEPFEKKGFSAFRK